LVTGKLERKKVEALVGEVREEETASSKIVLLYENRGA